MRSGMRAYGVSLIPSVVSVLSRPFLCALRPCGLQSGRIPNPVDFFPALLSRASAPRAIPSGDSDLHSRHGGATRTESLSVPESFAYPQCAVAARWSRWESASTSRHPFGLPSRFPSQLAERIVVPILPAGRWPRTSSGTSFRAICGPGAAPEVSARIFIP